MVITHRMPSDEKQYVASLCRWPRCSRSAREYPSCANCPGTASTERRGLHPGPLPWNNVHGRRPLSCRHLPLAPEWPRRLNAVFQPGVTVTNGRWQVAGAACIVPAKFRRSATRSSGHPCDSRPIANPLQLRTALRRITEQSDDMFDLLDPNGSCNSTLMRTIPTP
jgi:hypothetical protein